MWVCGGGGGMLRQEHLRQVGSLVYFLTVFSSIFKKLPITIHPLVNGEKTFKGFSIFSSGCYFVNPSETI